ncbi:MAG: hypothetical protein NTV54_08510 [Ignavibacteriales bacterium]|nr:hypothetical protein [Ignavibacteriales bacterium]
MYTSFIGNRFLEIYNKERKRKLSLKEYFEKEHFPLFYDHPQYLQSPANTPLFQVIAQKKTKNPKARQKAFTEIVEKINSFAESKDHSPDMSFALGFASADLLGTTSGQVTSLTLPFDAEDMYASWIGAGFGIGLAGGLNILLDGEEVLQAIKEGWSLYREYVDENKGIDNRVETWNGIWFSHRFSENYKPKSPRANFQPVSSGKDGEAKMERPSWTTVLLTLAKIYPKQTLNAYVYSFGQMNKTIGFVRCSLPEVHKMSELYHTLFGKNKILSNKELAQIYEPEYRFDIVCERFSMIGIRSFEPKDLRKTYMPSKSGSNEMPKFKGDEKSQIYYSIYILWVIAMLNNKDLLGLAEKAAHAFREYEKGGRKGTVTRDNEIKELLSSRNRKELIDRLTQLVEEEPTVGEVCNILVHELMENIAVDNVPLFVTLMRFKYALPN